MSCYTILEDCSPYFIRFTFDSLIDIISFVKSVRPTKNDYQKNYTHRTFNEHDSASVINMLPMGKDFDFQTNRVSVFSTPPGACSSVHKDGSSDRVSFNIPITVLDDNCITRWYSDEYFSNVEPWGLPYTRKVLYNRDGYDEVPTVKEMVAKPNEMILFNTDIYHSWENNRSRNIREVLTLRVKNVDSLYFNDAKSILFGQ